LLLREVRGSLLSKLIDQGLQRGIGLRNRNARLETHAGVVSSNLILGDLQRQIYVSITPCKSRRCDANNGVVLANHLNRLADNAMDRVEMTLPKFVTEHSNR